MIYYFTVYNEVSFAEVFVLSFYSRRFFFKSAIFFNAYFLGFKNKNVDKVDIMII